MKILDAHTTLMAERDACVNALIDEKRDLTTVQAGRLGTFIVTLNELIAYAAHASAADVLIYAGACYNMRLVCDVPDTGEIAALDWAVRVLLGEETPDHIAAYIA